MEKITTRTRTLIKQSIQEQISSQKQNDHNRENIMKEKKIKKVKLKEKTRKPKDIQGNQEFNIQQKIKELSCYFEKDKTSFIQDLIQKRIKSNILDFFQNSNRALYINYSKNNTQIQLTKYALLIKQLQQGTFQQLVLQNEYFKYQLDLIMSQKDSRIKLLNKNQAYLLLRQYQQKIKLQQKFQQHKRQNQSKGKLSEIIKHIFLLCKTNSNLENALIQKLKNIGQLKNQKQMKYLHNIHKYNANKKQNQLKKQLYTALLIKNFKHSMSEIPIDFLNYHKRLERQQQYIFGQINFKKQDTLDNITLLKQYLQKRKPRKHKNSQSLLKTPCTACLSDISELSNPIKNCPECHTRIHLHCQQVQKRCQRCVYGRMANQQKRLTGYCYICNRPNQIGFLVQKVTNNSPHRFAHFYCLLLHNLWQYNQKLAFEGKFNEYKIQKRQCKYCNNQSGIFFQCVNCKASLHGMCGYLKGCSLNLVKQKQLQKYSVEINCCNFSQQQKRLSIQRKFKLCYQKCLFRQNSYDKYKQISKQIFQFIQQSVMQQQK